ncbi:hypothetical protein C8J56DRAFT_978083 [Mycena floridula]|nr:hypothetical protein C8J56DRAFT_978083 [Mycena floridula]
MYVYDIPPQIYPIFWDIHKGCGFNPESTEMAEYMGYPLLEPVLEAVSTAENLEIDSDNGSENGSASSDDTFLSANSNI